MSKRRLFSIALMASAVIVAVCMFVYRQSASVEVISNYADRLTQLPRVAAETDDWNCWRGPNGTGIAESADPPIKWDRDTNVNWSVKLPGRGHSSPIVWGDHVFLTTADDAKQTQSLICLDLRSGNKQWETEIHSGHLPSKHEKNSHASATPVCDGTHVYTVFAVDDAVWVTAVDYSGEIVWQTEAGPFVSQRGYAPSPAIHGSVIIVSADNRGSKLGRLKITSFLAGLNCNDGTIVWRIQRPQVHSFGSPVVANVAGRSQLILSGGSQIAAYNPGTGELMWSCDSVNTRTANTLAFGNGLIFSSATRTEQEVLAIRAGGSGDITGSHIAWRTKRGAADVPSPVFHDGLLYVLSDGGVLTGFDPKDGSIFWRKRVSGNFSSSPVIAGRHLFIANEAGTTYVVTLGRAVEVVAENDLNEPILATPVFTGTMILIRTSEKLWSIRNERRDSG